MATVTGSQRNLNFVSNNYAQATFGGGGGSGDVTNTYLTATFTSNNYVQSQLGLKLNSSSYTASDVLTKIKTVDGSGSGLDADLLDGQQGSYYTQTVSDTALNSGNDLNSLTDGYYSWTSSQPTNSPGHTYMILLQVTDGGQPQQLAWGGSSNGKMYIRRRDSGTWYSWTKVWTDANDGSGSTLNADLLDGIHASGLVSNNYFQDNAGGGATGGGSDKIFYNNDQTVTTSYTIPSGQNSMTAGPISINSGVTVTVPSGSEWTIV